ncbi:MAG: sigma-70 family RNA polymerase sigma factor [Oscillospiraceae bacterium]|nr:sigma-70 family RNA polymerase sigma factor [Oscillospiraceae bacterium]MDD4367875.1 sigma-70 family RNA polymerase sigma factor [Oscillospiraceae bacterium]
MEDKQIVELYWARSEQAIHETAAKYGRYCRSIAWNILFDDEDSKECVNDTWLRAWTNIPPQRPGLLAPFLARITRNLALDRYRREHAAKRGGGQVELVLEDLEGCLSSPERIEEQLDEARLVDSLNRFLAGLSARDRCVFMRRYWYISRISEMAADYGMSESKVKSILFRTRKKLQRHLLSDGIKL